MKRRENFLPTLLLALLFWLGWIYFLFFQVPESNSTIFFFYLCLLLAFFLTVALLLANSRRGFLSALALIAFLLLRQFEQAHFLNLILVLAILSSIELYFWRK